MNSSSQNASRSIVFIRHGQSEANFKRFVASWYDSPLTEKGKRNFPFHFVDDDVTNAKICIPIGEKQGKNAGKCLNELNYKFDKVYASLLSRAVRTAELILENMNEHENVTLERNWLLNEWHRGALIGVDKKLEKLEKPTWKSRPPSMTSQHKHYNDIHNDLRYVDLKQQQLIPTTESHEDAQKRFIEFWETILVPELQQNKRILVVGHQNIFKGVVKYFDELDDEEAIQLKILNGKPFQYEFDENLKPKNKLKYID